MALQVEQPGQAAPILALSDLSNSGLTGAYPCLTAGLLAPALVNDCDLI